MIRNFHICVMAICLFSMADRAIAQQEKPPYGGTVYINKDLMTPADPTVYQSVTYQGREQARMWYDGLKWIKPRNAFIFTVHFKDGLSCKAILHPEYGNEKEARRLTIKYAKKIGQLPYFARENLKELWFTKSYTYHGANQLGAIQVCTEEKQNKVPLIYEEEVFFHEAGHASLDRFVYKDEAWKSAVKADGRFISNYAKNHPTREDIAESIMPWFILRHLPERMADIDKKKILKTMPNRLKYFDQQNYKIGPFKTKSRGGIKKQLVS